jgi:hypothetical protein
MTAWRAIAARRSRVRRREHLRQEGSDRPSFRGTDRNLSGRGRFIVQELHNGA